MEIHEEHREWEITREYVYFNDCQSRRESSQNDKQVFKKLKSNNSLVRATVKSLKCVEHSKKNVCELEWKESKN